MKPRPKSIQKLIVLVILTSMLSQSFASAQGPNPPGNGVRVHYNDATGKVSFIGADPSNPIVLMSAQAKGLTQAASAMILVSQYAADFGLRNPSAELRLISEKQVEGRKVTRFQQTYNEIPIMGAELIVNTTSQAELLSLSGEISPGLSLSTTPAISADEALQNSLNLISKYYDLPSAELEPSAPELWIYDSRLFEPDGREPSLVWRMEVRAKDPATPMNELVLVDAKRGNIVLNFNQIDTAHGHFDQIDEPPTDEPPIDETPIDETPTEEPTETPEPEGTPEEPVSAPETPQAETPQQDVSSQAASMVKYEDLVVDETRNRLYGANKDENKVDVISMSDLSIISSYALSAGTLPNSLDISPDGNELAIAQSGTGIVKFINLTDDSTSEIPTALTGTNTKVTDVIYGRAGVLYALSSKGLHVIDLTVTPHAEDTTQYVSIGEDSTSYSERFGVVSSDKNTLYYVTGSSSSGYQRLAKYDVSNGLANPTLLKGTHINSSGYMKGIRLSLIDSESLLVTTGIVYNTSNLTPKAKNFQSLNPAAVLNGRDFYATFYNNTNTADELRFFDNENSHKLSSLSSDVPGTTGAIASTSDGNTLFASSTGGMTKFTIGETPPGQAVDLPASLQEYHDIAFDLPRGLAYGTDPSGRIDIIDLGTANVTGSFLLPSGASPKGIDLDPDGSELAIALYGLEKIIFINPETGGLTAEVTPQLSENVYYTNRPFDVIFGRSGRLYSIGYTGGISFDYTHVVDTSTHTWISKSSNVMDEPTELILRQDNNRLYAAKTTGTPKNIFIFKVETDTVTKLYQGPHGTVSGSAFTVVPDGSKIFTSTGQVWDSIMQSQLGSLEGGGGKLIKYIPSLNVIALSDSGTSGDLIRFISPVDYHILATYDPPSSGAINEMESAPDGSKLILNINNGIQILNLDPALAISITTQSGSNQAAQVETPFSDPLKAKVSNILGDPLPGISVTFTAPASGASGIFEGTNSTTSTAITDENGVATSPIFIGNVSSGSYAVSATVADLAMSADFQLTNIPLATCSIENGVGSTSLLKPYKRYNCGLDSHGVGTGDFNNDGRQDVALSARSGTGFQHILLIFLQNSNGNLTQPISYSAGKRSEYLAVGDFNHDGLDDVATLDNFDGTVSVYLQNGGGTLNNRVTYATNTGPDAIAAGDINNDGRDDIVISHWNSPTIGVFTQKPDGTLNSIVTYPTIAQGNGDIAIDDINNDGLNDVIKMNGQGNNANALVIHTQNNNHTLNPYTVKTCSSPCIGNGMGVGDITGDGRADIVMSYGGNTSSAKIAVFAQDENGALLPSVSHSSYDIPQPVEIADLNSDGLLDVVVLHGGWLRGGVYLQQNNGTLGTESLHVIPYRSHYYSQDLVIADVNNDGLPDILVADGQGLVILYHALTPSQGSFIHTYSANHTTTLPGQFLCDETMTDCTQGENLDADTAQHHAIGTYQLYNDKHGRNSIDNQGMNIVSTVNFYTNYQNAFWSGSQMVYGDGYGFAHADDVVAHELTHGVTQYESNLFYFYQSGAINESLSDIWGEYYDQINGIGNDSAEVEWLIGEDVTGLGAFRSMSNPPTFNDPDKMTSPLYFKSYEDNGGVHYNSGVNNKAAYLMVEGGTFNGRTVVPLGWDKTAAIYYEVQTNLLTSGSDYADLYHALYQACLILVDGPNSITADDCQQVRNATDAVEMNLQPAANFNPDAPLCGPDQPFETVFLDDLESGTSNWTFANGIYTRWQYDSPFGTYAHSGIHSLYADDYPPTATSASATLAPVVLPEEEKAYLHFAHVYDFERTINNSAYYDGGVLEYSIDAGGSWQDAGGLMDYNGYKGNISANYDNPLKGKPAFVGSSHGYISTRLDLASLAGETVQFRWRLGLDSWGYYLGWFVDDVHIFTCPNSQTASLPSFGLQDGWILESSETSNKGGTLNKGATTLRLGDDAANRQYRTILSFDTASLPEGAVITSATLTFKYAGKSGTIPFNTHGKLLADICDGPFKANPALQLGDFNAKCPAGMYKAKALIFTKTKVNNWYSQALNPADYQYINTNGVTQFRLRFAKDDNNDFGADFLKLYSGNAGAANRPQLIVEYYIP